MSMMFYRYDIDIPGTKYIHYRWYDIDMILILIYDRYDIDIIAFYYVYRSDIDFLSLLFLRYDIGILSGSYWCHVDIISAWFDMVSTAKSRCICDVIKATGRRWWCRFFVLLQCKALSACCFCGRSEENVKYQYNFRVEFVAFWYIIKILWPINYSTSISFDVLVAFQRRFFRCAVPYDMSKHLFCVWGISVERYSVFLLQYLVPGTYYQYYY